MPITPTPTYGDIEGFIVMMEVACEDAEINTTLQHLLTQPDATRRQAIHNLTAHLRQRDADATLIQALACLLDDHIAEQAYVRIFQCARNIAP